MNRLLLSVLFVMSALTGIAQSPSVASSHPSFPKRIFTVLTYNCENAFDTIHDAGHDDVDFLPEGKNHWTRARYFRKLRRIAQVLAAADTLKPVDIAVLEEVENDTVLTHLLRRTQLHNFALEYIMTHNQTARGIDVAIIYSPRTFQMIGHDEVSLSETDESIAHVRPVLHAWGRIASGDTLDVYAVHLPSKLGARTADQLRRAIATRLRQHIDSVFAIRSFPILLVTGDFNDTPRSPVFKTLHTLSPLAKKGKTSILSDPSPLSLYNMMEHRAGGSYKYQGDWNWIDQMLVSGNLLRTDSPLYADYTSVVALQSPFLLETDEAYRGYRPFRTFLGPRYYGGYSDHLPVVIRFQQQ